MRINLNIFKIRVFQTVLWSGCAAILSFAINMLITPLVTNRLGTEAYGYVSLANNFISYITIFTMALNSFATRYISLEYHNKNKKIASTYFNSVLFTNLLFCILVFIIFIVIIVKLENIIVIPEKLVADVKKLFVLMYLNFAALLLGNTFIVSSYIKDRLDLAGIFKTLGYIIEIIVLIVSFYCFQAKLWYVGLGYLTTSLVILLSSFLLYRKLTPDLQTNYRLYSIVAVKKLVLNGLWNSFNELGNTLNSGLDLLITNLLLSPLLMGQISIAKNLGSIVCSLYYLVSQAFQPIFLRIYATNKKEELLISFQHAMKLSGLIAGLFFCGFVTLGKEFYYLWIPNQDIDYIYRLTVITLTSYVLEGIIGPLYYIYTLTLKNKFPCIVTIIGGILNVLFMLLIIQFFNGGGYVVVGTTTVIMIFINLVTNPLYMTKCLKIEWYSFYPVIGRYIIFNIVSIIILKIIFRNIIVKGWGGFILSGILLCIISSIIYFIIVLNKDEKILLIKKIRK